jgi:hypothetical protein
MTSAGLQLDIRTHAETVRQRCERMLSVLSTVFPTLTRTGGAQLAIEVHSDPQSAKAQSLLVAAGLSAPAVGGFTLSVKVDPAGGIGWIVADGDALSEAGCAALLKEFNFAFSLAGDVVPDPLPEMSTVDAVREVRPRFQTRGTQLWCFWYPGRDAWGIKEYRQYLDQFPKLGLNLLDVPLYLYEPLYTGYNYGGVTADEVHLSGLNLSNVRVGRAALDGAPERLVSRDIPLNASGSERHRAALTLMREVIDYAHSLGVKTCYGIEPGNALDFGTQARSVMPASDLYEDGRLIQPSSPSARSFLRSRLTALFESYPDSDYYGLWQSEAGLWRSHGGSTHPEDVAFREALQAKHPDVEAPDADYLRWLQLADELAAELKPDARFVTNGWGCEAIFQCADEVLSDRFVRSSIAKYEPKMTVDGDRLASYADTKGEKWNVTWAETDQHMHIVQPKFEASRAVIDRLEELGATGLQVLHWTTVHSQINLDFIASQMWSPQPSVDEFLIDWATRRVGNAAAPNVARAFRLLEELNNVTIDADPDMSSWPGFECGLAPPMHAHRFVRTDAGIPKEWFRGSRDPLVAVQAEMLSLASRAATEARSALENSAADGSQRVLLVRLAELFAYVDAYHSAHFQVLDAAHAWHEAATSKTAGPDKFTAALDLIDESLPVRAIEHLVASLNSEDPNLGQLGVLVAVNEKLLGGVNRLVSRMRRAIAGKLNVTQRDNPAALITAWPGMAETDVQYELENYTWNSEALVETVRTADRDQISCADGWAVHVADGVESLRLTAEIGSWRHEQHISLAVNGPIGARARLRLYFWEESGWNSLFRRILVRINGEAVTTVVDFLGNGEDQSEGVWVEQDVELVDGTASISLERVGTADVQLCGLIVETA